jgi:hypothetical protein
VHVPDSAAARRPLANTWRSLPLAAFLTAYFLWFNWGSLRVRFALDDLANFLSPSPGKPHLATAGQERPDLLQAPSIESSMLMINTQHPEFSLQAHLA